MADKIGRISDMAVNRERVQVNCPACGQQVEASARDGRVKGYCAVAKQYVDFQIEAQSTALTKVKEGRDTRGRFIKGNVPENKEGKLPV